MINWLITMFTEWLMQICYFYSFSNTIIGNPYNVFWLIYFYFYRLTKWLEIVNMHYILFK